MKLEDIIERLGEEQIDRLTELLVEIKQIKLHQASMSDEPITERSVEVDN